MVKMLIGYAYRLAGRPLPDERELALEAHVWEYALGDVPTHHLDECFRWAIREHEGQYMVTATEIRQQYEQMKPELLRQRGYHAESAARLLQAGHGSLGQMHLPEFRERHNLPVEWELGQPYPPESDLYGRGEGESKGKGE